MRNIRLAEHGFLPRDEAMVVYAPLKPESLKMDAPNASDQRFRMKMTLTLFPVGRFSTFRGKTSWPKPFQAFRMQRLLDRIRLEFAGLCNQIVSAEGLVDRDVDELQEIRLQAGRLLEFNFKGAVLRGHCIRRKTVKNEYPFVSVSRGPSGWP